MSTYRLVGFIGDWRDNPVSLGKYQPVVQCEQSDEYFQVRRNVDALHRLIPLNRQDLGYVNLFEESCCQPFDVRTDGECFVLQSSRFYSQCDDVIELPRAWERLNEGWFGVRIGGAPASMSSFVGRLMSALEAEEFIEELYEEVKNFFFPRIFLDSAEKVTPILKASMALLSALPRACDEEWLLLQGVFFYQKLLFDDYELVEHRAMLQFNVTKAEFKNMVMERIAWASEKRFILKSERVSLNRETFSPELAAESAERLSDLSFGVSKSADLLNNRSWSIYYGEERAG